MRKFILMMTLLAVFAGARAQKSNNYWVVETEGKASYSVVKIYDSSNNLVNETKATRLIDTTKKKERRKLNKMLKQYDNPQLWSKR